MIARSGKPRVRPAFAIASLTLALALLVAATSAAAATTYYVSVNGSGTSCTQAEPCSMSQILTTTTTSGDVVVLEGGEGAYGSPLLPMNSPIHIPAGVTWTGAPGLPMPVVYSEAANPSSAAVEVVGSGSRVEDIDIEYSGNYSAIYVDGGSVERVLARAGTAGEGCNLPFQATVTDSVCEGRSGAITSVGGGGTETVSLRNDTIYGTVGAGYFARTTGPEVDLSATNTAIRTRGSGSDIEARVSSGSISFALDHSNYATVFEEGAATVTAPGSGTDQTTEPSFSDAAAGDFRELAGSPTIDAGLQAGANGSLDLAGSPRNVSAVAACTEPQPGPPDIGAYELVPSALPASACAEPESPAPTGSSSGTAPASGSGAAGGAGPPTAPAPALASLRVVGLKYNRHRGTAVLSVRVSGAGALTLTGKRLVKRTASPTAAGVVKLAVAARGKARKALVAKGKLKTRAKIVFVPAGGSALRATRKLTLRLRPAA